MARPRLPETEKKLVVSIRLPPPTVARLAQEAGAEEVDGELPSTRFASKRVRQLVDTWARSLTPEGMDVRALASVDADAPSPIISVDENISGVAPHRHRRGKLKAKTYEAGVEQRHYECTEPGCTTTLN